MPTSTVTRVISDTNITNNLMAYNIIMTWLEITWPKKVLFKFLHPYGTLRVCSRWDQKFNDK